MDAVSDSTSSSRSACLNATPSRSSISAQRASTLGALFGAAQTWSFQPWSSCSCPRGVHCRHSPLTKCFSRHRRRRRSGGRRSCSARDSTACVRCAWQHSAARLWASTHLWTRAGQRRRRCGCRRRGRRRGQCRRRLRHPALCLRLSRRGVPQAQDHRHFPASATRKRPSAPTLIREDPKERARHCAWPRNRSCRRSARHALTHVTAELPCRSRGLRHCWP